MFKNLFNNLCKWGQAYNILAIIEKWERVSYRKFLDWQKSVKTFLMADNACRRKRMGCWTKKNIKVPTTRWRYLHLNLISSSLILNLWMSSWRKTDSQQWKHNCGEGNKKLMSLTNTPPQESRLHLIPPPQQWVTSLNTSLTAGCTDSLHQGNLRQWLRFLSVPASVAGSSPAGDPAESYYWACDHSESLVLNI